MSAFKLYAAALLDLGYSPVPILPGEKRPLPVCAFYDHWNDLRREPLTEKQIGILARSNSSLGLGVAGGYRNLVPVDYDANDPAIKRAAFGVLPKISVAKVAQKGGTSFYRGAVAAMKFRARNGDGWEMLLEVLSTGQTVIPPTVHPAGMAYRWVTPATLLNTRIEDLPEISQGHIDNLKEALQPWLPKTEQQLLRRVYSPTVEIDNRMRRYARSALHNESQRLARLSEGRNWGLYVAVCRLGRYVAHGALTEYEVQDALMQASNTNGYTAAQHGGPKQAWKTINSGLNKTRGDSLPDLSSSPVNRSVVEDRHALPF